MPRSLMLLSLSAIAGVDSRWNVYGAAARSLMLEKHIEVSQ